LNDFTIAELRLWEWALEKPTTLARVVAELAGTIEARTPERVREDIRGLVAAGYAASYIGGVVWVGEAGRLRGQTIGERIEEILQIGPRTFGQIIRALMTPPSATKSALTKGPFRERAGRWHYRPPGT
jgi:hypothetical protein